MWGEQWGTMIWGDSSGVLAVPVPIGPVALIILGFLLGISALKWQSSRVAKIFVVSLVMAVPLLVVATTLPHQFSNGTVADADEVNANFLALEQQIVAQRSAFEVSVSANSILPKRLVNIDQVVFDELCGDTTGCTVRMCSSTASDPVVDPNLLPSCRDVQHISYDEVSGLYRAGTFVDQGVAFLASSDNNGQASNLVTFNDFGDCALTDADELDPILGEQDTMIGFSLLNSEQVAGFTCSLVLID